MQAVWNTYTARLEASLRLNALAARESMRLGAENALARIRRNLAVEIILDALLVVVIGGFGVDRAVSSHDGVHVDVPVAAATGLLGAYAIAILICAVLQLVSFASVGYDEPVFVIAQRFDRFRLVRTRAAFWTMLFAPLMWVPIATIVLFDNVPASTLFGSAWFVGNIAFGVLVLGGGLLLARRIDCSGDPHDPMQRFAATLSGRSVREAAQRLEALRRYEAETEALAGD